jgi:hypothetical protein
MRISEQQSQAWQALLERVEKEPILIFFRGIDLKDKKLYQITNIKGDSICPIGTEHEIMDNLRKEIKGE